ncbi:MAG TPA: hypothetical protein VJR89_26455, partial [Polyangiales bacterium]|nr:hypothetical protein [Polyangiales bacterium]
PPSAARAMPWDSQPAPVVGDAQAQAIVAAFDAAEADPPRTPVDDEPEDSVRDTLESSPAPVVRMEPAPSLELDRPPRRGEWSGSRRPDLNELLDQPLDALDFESSEQTDVVPTPVPDPDAADAEPAAARDDQPADDFEILVDDEILEIAEDDVEIVDDENDEA